MNEERSAKKPAERWHEDAERIFAGPNLANASRHKKLNGLRLAAMAGHMARDMVAARRAALIDLLAAGRPYGRESIWRALEGQLRRPCWGRRPEETLLRDLRALRRGGLRIAYSRRPGAEGYYLQHPPLERLAASTGRTINWQQANALRELPLAEKNRLAFEVAESTLAQEAFGGALDVLEEIGARYAIWGGWAVVAYGEPRPTRDMDILLSPIDFDHKSFTNLLQAGGYQVNELMLFSALDGGDFEVIHQPGQIGVDFFLPRQYSLQHKAIAERVYLPFDEKRRAAYITAEALVISKLQTYAEGKSTRQLDDIAAVVRIQGEQLDRAQIDIAAAQMGLLGLWRAIWADNQPAKP
jgi:hypothetical protein